MNSYVETERLLLREILPSDADALFELDSDPEVHRYVGQRPVSSKDQILAVIDIIRQQYQDNGIGRWAVTDKKTKEVLGWAGLKWVTEPVNGHQHYYDLGYRIIRRFWGKGIASEAAFAALPYAFNELHAPAVYAIANTANAASNRILQKVGFSPQGRFTDDGAPHTWYRITLAEFEQR